MKSSHTKDVDRRMLVLKKRSPWMASLLQHCLETRDPRACGAMRVMLSRLRLKTA
jgi:hypothetical protein